MRRTRFVGHNTPNLLIFLSVLASARKDGYTNFSVLQLRERLFVRKGTELCWLVLSERLDEGREESSIIRCESTKKLDRQRKSLILMTLAGGRRWSIATMIFDKKFSLSICIMCLKI